MTEERQKKGISRRTVVKGAAWAVPAVPIVVATPAYAASPQCITVTLSGTSCKWPGSPNKWAYRLTVCFANDCGVPYTLYNVRITNNSGKPFTYCETQDALCTRPLPSDGIVVVQPGATNDCYGACAYYSASSAHSVEVYASFTPDGPEVMLLSTPAPTVPCDGNSPC